MKLSNIDLKSIEHEVTGKCFDDPQIIINYAEDLKGEPLSDDSLDVLNGDPDVHEYLADLFYRGEL